MTTSRRLEPRSCGCGPRGPHNKKTCKNLNRPAPSDEPPPPPEPERKIVKLERKPKAPPAETYDVPEGARVGSAEIPAGSMTAAQVAEKINEQDPGRASVNPEPSLPGEDEGLSDEEIEETERILEEVAADPPKPIAEELRRGLAAFGETPESIAPVATRDLQTGDRVRVVGRRPERGPNVAENKYAGREGRVHRMCSDTFTGHIYVLLDKKPREKTQKSIFIEKVALELLAPAPTPAEEALDRQLVEGIPEAEARAPFRSDDPGPPAPTEDEEQLDDGLAPADNAPSCPRCGAPGRNAPADVVEQLGRAFVCNACGLAFDRGEKIPRRWEAAEPPPLPITPPIPAPAIRATGKTPPPVIIHPPVTRAEVVASLAPPAPIEVDHEAIATHRFDFTTAPRSPYATCKCGAERDVVVRDGKTVRLYRFPKGDPWSPTIVRCPNARARA